MEPKFGFGSCGVGKEAGTPEQVGHRSRGRGGKTQRSAIARELFPGGTQGLDETQIDLGDIREIERHILAVIDNGEQMRTELRNRSDRNRFGNIYDPLHQNPVNLAHGRAAIAGV